MAKRFTDSDKWRDPWFYDLTPVNKLFWIFLLDNCDHAGIWKINWNMTVVAIGDRPNLSEFKDRIIKISEGKYFIPKFLTYQYGKDWLNSQAKAKTSAMKLLVENGIDPVTLSIELPNSCQRITATATAPTKAKATTTAFCVEKKSKIFPSEARR